MHHNQLKSKEELDACRLCGNGSLGSVIDLGWSPVANNYCTAEELNHPVTYYPLHAVICSQCKLVQLTTSPPPETHFTDYRYFSSYSATMVEHARRYAEEMVKRFGIGSNSQVIELASNDGYLLQHFKTVGIPVLGIEPASNVAEVAHRRHGIRTIDRFFGLTLARELAHEKIKADLLIANNVLAHVPDPNDFIAGMAALLSPEGIITIEFPDLANLLEQGQFDTIYHEHISYLSLNVVEQLLASYHLRIFDTETIAVHGGSLRIYACHEKSGHTSQPRVKSLSGKTYDYQTLPAKAQKIKHDLLSFLLKAKAEQKQVVGYGAPAKGNTLLNYCGIHGDLLPYTVDASPYKQGLYLPGSAIPIHAPLELQRTQPDYVLILPWNLKEEIIAEHSYIENWGGKFVTAIPELRILTA